MKALFAFILLAPFCVLAQHGAIQVTGDEKYAFTLFVDGLAENDKPASTVIVHRLKVGEHFLKIVFAQTVLQSPKQKIEVLPDKKIDLRLVFIETRRGIAVQIEKDGQTNYIVPPSDTISHSIVPPRPSPITTSADKAQNLFENGFNKPDSSQIKSTDSIAQPKSTADSGYAIKEGCGRLIPPKAFELIVQSVFAEPLEDAQLERARILARENCLTSIQIMEIVQRFEFENSKLELAKYAYDYCFDPDNYHFVEDAFLYEVSKTKLRGHISQRPDSDKGNRR